VEVISDSKYVVNTINQWIACFASNPSRVNHDLMVKLQSAITFHESVKGRWVAGHSGNEFNDLVDMWARREAGTYKEKV